MSCSIHKHHSIQSQLTTFTLPPPHPPHPTPTLLFSVVGSLSLISLSLSLCMLWWQGEIEIHFLKPAKLIAFSFFPLSYSFFLLSLFSLLLLHKEERRKARKQKPFSLFSSFSLLSQNFRASLTHQQFPYPAFSGCHCSSPVSSSLTVLFILFFCILQVFFVAKFVCNFEVRTATLQQIHLCSNQWNFMRHFPRIVKIGIFWVFPDLNERFNWNPHSLNNLWV